jgi:putative ATP-dependent endonuclease of OLD family
MNEWYLGQSRFQSDLMRQNQPLIQVLTHKESSVRLVNMKIKNYRSIGSIEGSHAVDLEIDSNNMIFLCGKNNAGKSTLMSAYEMFVTAGKKAKLSDFYNSSTENQIEIEASVRAENQQDREHRALTRLWNDEGIARIKKTWREEDGDGIKESFDPENGWVAGGAGGFDTLLQNAFPTPVWIKGTSTPDEVVALLKILVQETILKDLATDQRYQSAVDAVRQLEQAITQSPYAASLQRNMNHAITSVFPGVSFSFKTDDVKEVVELFKSSTAIEIVEGGHPNLGFSNHGHGVRRQFVVSAFRGLAMQLEEVSKTAKARRPDNYQIAEIGRDDNIPKSRMLLMEEPELFLHPSAIRSVRDLLYALASSSEFQIIAATHSPVVIDLSKSHTTLVRVESAEGSGTKIFQVSNTLFSADERETMKMLNYFDPYVCEAFFANKVVLVEGDTEAVAIRELIARFIEAGEANALEDIHVVNCGTKMNIPFFQKVMTHFSIPYFVLHDMDSKLSANGNRNPAWTLNERIWAGIEETRRMGGTATRFVFETEFESANGYVLDEALGKPFSAYRQAAQWALNDDQKSAIRFLRMIGTGQSPNPEFTQEYLEIRANEP